MTEIIGQTQNFLSKLLALKASDLIICPLLPKDYPRAVGAAEASFDGLTWWGALTARSRPNGIPEVYNGAEWLYAAQRSNWQGTFDVEISDLTDEQVLLRFRFTQTPMMLQRLMWLRNEEVKRGIDLKLKQKEREFADLLQFAWNLGIITKVDCETKSRGELAEALPPACERYTAQVPIDGTQEQLDNTISAMKQDMERAADRQKRAEEGAG